MFVWVGGGWGGVRRALRSRPSLNAHQAHFFLVVFPLAPQTKKLPLSTPISALKQLAFRLFKCDPSLQRLSFRDSPASYPSLMDDDSKTLSYYAVTEGEHVSGGFDWTPGRRVCDGVEYARDAVPQPPFLHPALFSPHIHAFPSFLPGGEILIEEVDPAEAARQAAEAEAAKAARIAEQEKQGEALRKAQEQSVAANRRAAVGAALD